MLYAFLGSTLLGALSTALLLWRKSVVERKLTKAESESKSYFERANRFESEMYARTKAYEDQLTRQRAQLDTLRGERDNAIDSLQTHGAPGSVLDLLRKQSLKA